MKHSSETGLAEAVAKKLHEILHAAWKYVKRDCILVSGVHEGTHVTRQVFAAHMYC